MLQIANTQKKKGNRLQQKRYTYTRHAGSSLLEFRDAHHYLTERVESSIELWCGQSKANMSLTIGHPVNLQYLYNIKPISKFSMDLSKTFSDGEKKFPCLLLKFDVEQELYSVVVVNTNQRPTCQVCRDLLYGEPLTYSLVIQHNSEFSLSPHQNQPSESV